MFKFFLGLLIILTGTFYLLTNLGFNIGLENIFATYWPIIIIIFGLKTFFKGLIWFVKGLKIRQWNTAKLLWGTLISLIGVILLGNNLNFFFIEVKDILNIIWPLFIIYLGLKVLFKPGKKNSDITIVKKKYNHINKFSIGEIILGKEKPWDLTDDLYLKHGIGSIYIDLSEALISKKENFIDIDGIIGEVTMLIPQDLPVKIEAEIRGIGEIALFNNKHAGSRRHVIYISDNYELAVEKVKIKISLSIGEINIKQVL